MKDRYQRHIGGFLLGISIAVLALAQGKRVTSDEQACNILRHAAVTFHLSTHDYTGRYYCEQLDETENYIILGLRVRLPPGESYSNLVGWFAVRISDGKVFDWDINSEEPKPLAQRPPFEK